MFKDLLTYCPNIMALRLELVECGFVDDNGEPVFPLENKTPTQNRNKPVTASLVRCLSDSDVELLNSFESLEVLGTKEEVDADPEKTAKYESAYSREPVVYVDSETGERFTHTPPKWHGAFA